MNSKETMYVQSNEIVFKLDLNNHTAGVHSVKSLNNEILIPCSITFQKQNYIVTKILSRAFTYLKNLKSVQFPKDSHVYTFEQHSFYYSSIEKITFPASLTELRGNWCSNCWKLTSMNIMRNNPRYSIYKKKFVIGKSSIDKKNYDVLVYSIQSIESAVLPDYIEIIGPYAFSGCKNLKYIEFSPKSKLQAIEKYAFFDSSIENITLPSTITHIDENAFAFCQKLKKVDIPLDSNLQIIDKYAFCSTLIESFTVPSNVISINDFAFSKTEKLQKVIFTPNSKLKTIGSNAFEGSSIVSINLPSSLEEIKEQWCRLATQLVDITIMPNNPFFQIYDNKFIVRKSSIDKNIYDILVYVLQDNKTVIIPDFIETIESCAFCCNVQLQSVETSINSNLRKINKHAFYNSSIERLILPPSLEELDENWYFEIPNLNKIEIIGNNQNYMIYDDNFIIGKSSIEKECYDTLVFSVRNIETVQVPDFIEIIGSLAFSRCLNIKEIKFSSESKLQKIEKKAFYYSNIEKITLPTNLKQIDDEAFYSCKNLKKVVIPLNSELQLIGKETFHNTAIEKISIPKHVKQICERCFFACIYLHHVEIPENSELQIIEYEAFHNSDVNSILIPSHVKKIGDCTFGHCYQLQKIVIPQNSELTSIGDQAFYLSSITSFWIPPHINHIGEESFLKCMKLQIIEINETYSNSIDQNFILRRFEQGIIMIPSQVKITGL